MGSFVEYKVIYHFTQENQVEYGILVERVDRIFGNGSMLFNLTTGNLNQSIYMPSSLVLDNFTSPHYFLWVPRPGEREIYRGIQFTLLNETDGLFVYMGQQELDRHQWSSISSLTPLESPVGRCSYRSEITDR